MQIALHQVVDEGGLQLLNRAAAPSLPLLALGVWSPASVALYRKWAAIDVEASHHSARRGARWGGTEASELWHGWHITDYIGKERSGRHRCMHGEAVDTAVCKVHILSRGGRHRCTWHKCVYIYI